MLRLTFLLCIGMFAALMIAGEDRGQLRPGLAEAASKVDAAANTVLPASESTAGIEPAALALVSEPVTAPVSVAVEEEAVVVSADPAPYVEPERELVTAVEEPIFTLSAVGNELVPAGPETSQETESAPEVPAGGEGTIWYVSASSVNVRAQPTTDAEVVGKLGSGEATLMVQAVNDEWARIVVQGDGVEGFVALRYLSPEAP
jgi:uncharacterized protein YgiM (DUF1202 family)